MRKCRESLKKHAMIINFEKKKMIPLTNKALNVYPSHKVCLFAEKYLKKKMLMTKIL